MRTDLSTEGDALNTGLLDHAEEFVAQVARQAPSEYRELLQNEEIRQRLQASNTFNPGKLYAWAEYRVFRKEFALRFPEADQHACINAFSRMFLKNDISISNLVAYLEPGNEEERMLESSGKPKKNRPE